MFFWMIVAFAVAWGLFQWELDLLRDRKHAQEMNRPIPRPPPRAPLAGTDQPAPAAAAEDEAAGELAPGPEAPATPPATAPDAPLPGAVMRE